MDTAKKREGGKKSVKRRTKGNKEEKGKFAICIVLQCILGSHPRRLFSNVFLPRIIIIIIEINGTIACIMEIKLNCVYKQSTYC